MKGILPPNMTPERRNSGGVRNTKVYFHGKEEKKLLCFEHTPMVSQSSACSSMSSWNWFCWRRDCTPRRPSGSRRREYTSCRRRRSLDAHQLPDCCKRWVYGVQRKAGKTFCLIFFRPSQEQRMAIFFHRILTIEGGKKDIPHQPG